MTEQDKIGSEPLPCPFCGSKRVEVVLYNQPTVVCRELNCFVDSPLWEESGDVVKVFLTLMATKNDDHVCRLDPYQIARKCVLCEVRVLEILKVLASPDERRKIKQPHDGRRIKAVEGGWLVLNGEEYRQMVSDEMRKARWRRAQATYREKKREDHDHRG